MNTKIDSINLPNGENELHIIKSKGLDEKPKRQVAIIGNIDSVLRFLEKRSVEVKEVFENTDEDDYDNVIFPYQSHILICRDEKSIELIFNETDPYAIGNVKGKLEIHKDFEKWGINEGREWGHQKLAEFIKMNRSLFTDTTLAMKLFKELKDIKIKTDNEYERSTDNRGSERTLIAQKVIQSNIPESFTLNVPIFKGQPKKEIEVELYVNPSSYAVTLISPQANDIIQEVLDNIIDEQKKYIQQLCPALVIIEK